MKASTIFTRTASPRVISILRNQAHRYISTRELDSLQGGRERIIILGSGWAGFNLSRQLDKKKFQTIVVSPRSYFAFTPLLASTAVGTLEFRTAIEPVRGRTTDVEFFQGWADDVDFNRKRITVEETAIDSQSLALLTSSLSDPSNVPSKGKNFTLDYDKLVVAVGCYSQTFNTPGVKQNALFLKDVGDARKIRTRILACFEKASLPSTPESLRRSLLNFAVVGGGPTGVEFSAELFDLCNQDLKRHYPELIKHVKITIYDVAPKILSMFDASLANYALNIFRRDGISVRTSHHILSLKKGLPGMSPEDPDSVAGFTLTTKEDGETGVGMVVWSTGLMMNPFVQKALNSVHTYPVNSIASSTNTSLSPLGPTPESYRWMLKRHPKSGGLMVDSKFRLQLVSQPNKPRDSVTSMSATMKDVFALGDVAVLNTGQLPATAQVANQEAKWLAQRLNKGDLDYRSFSFKNLGVMAFLGGTKAIMQTGDKTEIKGWMAWLIWRGAYLTKTISWRNKILIPIYWVVNSVLGRDISRF